MATHPTLSDLYRFGAPAASFGSLSDGDRQDAIAAAYAELEAAATAQGKTPLGDPLPDDVRQKICHVAAYELMSRVGFNPTAGADANYLVRANTARAYFRDIARGIVRPAFIFDAPRESRAQPKVVSKPLRGW
jgi:hypothetical protein